MTVEYRIPPFKHLAGSPQVVKTGRECQFHGHVKDFNEVTSRYVVIVNKVAPTSGHVEVTSNAISAGSQGDKKSTSAGRAKNKKFSTRGVNAPFKSPIATCDSSPTLGLGASDTTPSSIGSGSGTLADASIPDPPVSQPPKKRARAPPKRKATKGVVIPNSDEI